MNYYKINFLKNRLSFTIIPSLTAIIIFLSFTVKVTAQIIYFSIPKEVTIKAPQTKLNVTIKEDEKYVFVNSKGWYKLSPFPLSTLVMTDVSFRTNDFNSLLKNIWIKGKENGFDKPFKDYIPKNVLRSTAKTILNIAKYYSNNPLEYWGYSDLNGGVIPLMDWTTPIKINSTSNKITKSFDSLYTKKDLTNAMNETIRWAKYIIKVLDKNIKVSGRSTKNYPGIISLPKSKTIMVTVTRTKKKAKIDSTKLDISGCWEDDKGRKITIRQKGIKVTAIHSKYGKREFKGLLKNGEVSLLYKFKNVDDYASIPWTWDDPNQQAPKKVLKQALVEQAKHNWGFVFKLINKDKLSGEMLGHYITWEEKKLTNFSLKKYSTTWKRHKVKLSSITITDKTFKKKLSEVILNGNFWIKATASSGCKEFVDRVTVEVYPKSFIIQKEKVELIETGRNTLEFQSPEEFSLFSLGPAIPPDIIVVRSGFRGTTIKVVNPKGYKSPKEKLLEEKKKIEIDLKKIEEKITQYNLYPEIFGEGLKETLQKELEHIEELILEQMRAKNELLMQYPNADVSEYDKDIKDLKVKRESVKGQLQDVSVKVDKEFKRLKIKKAELEKRLKEILKELNY